MIGLHLLAESAVQLNKRLSFNSSETGVFHVFRVFGRRVISCRIATEVSSTSVGLKSSVVISV